MARHLNLSRSLGVTLLATLFAPIAWADRLVAINFNAGQGRSNAGNAANKLADATEVAVAGYTINGQYWNQYQCAATATHAEGVTVYDTEAGTTETKALTVATTASGNYTVNNAAEQNVTNGYMDDGNGVKVTLSAAPFDKYDIILIQATDTASRKFAPSIINGVLYKSDANGNAVLAAHKTDNWGASRTTEITLGTNAMRVNNLCGPLTIYGGRNLNSAQRGGIAGLVIIERTTPMAQVYLANEDCTASNSGGVGNYKPVSMTVPVSAVTPEGAKLWIDAVTFCLEGANAAKAGSITLADVQSGSPTVAGEWNVTSLDGSSSMGPRITFPFATAAKVTVGTTATMSAPAISRFRLYNTTEEKWGAVLLDASMNAWRPAYQIAARVPGLATVDGTVAAWTDLTWAEKNPFVSGAPVELTVAGESTLTLGSAVSCAELVITGSADLTITDPQNLAYTKLDLTGFTGRLILDHTSSTVINDHIGDDTTDYLMGNVIGGTIVIKGSAIVGLTKINNNPIALDGTTLRIEGGLVKVNSKDQGGNLKNATIELAGGRIYNYGWFESTGTMTLDATTDADIFCKYCSGAPAIVKKGAATVSFVAGNAYGNFTSIKAEAGTLAFTGNPVTATTLFAGEGFVEIPSGKTLTVGSLAGEGDIKVTGAGTLKVQNDSDFAGTLNLSGSVTLDLGGLRPSFALATADTAVVKVQVGATDDGEVTFKGAVANVTVVDGDNAELEVTKTTTEATTVVSFPISVSGSACWIAYEFNGSLASVGVDKTALSRDQDDRQYRYGDDATSDFRPAGEGYDALYAGSHPWRNITYKDSFTCAMYGTLPQADEAGLLVFGSTTSAPQGLIGLMTGSVANNTVLLVRSTGSQSSATKYETMAEMSVPNPFTTPHLYIFSKTGRTIKVYLDGILWTTYESTTDFVIGPGFQICSVHGGSFTTGVNRFAPPSRDEAQNNPIYKDCVIDSLRLYDGVLGEKAIAELVKEFPYVSPNGSYSRTVGTEATWTEEDAWTRASDSSLVAAPAAGSALTLQAADAEASVTVNLDETTTYEAITFGGAEGSALAVKKGTGLVVNAGQTVVTVPTTLAMGAMTIAGGPTVITGAGSLAFDYAALDVDSYKADAFIQLTGLMDEADGKVACTLPDESTYSDRTVAFGYDTASKTYRITITMNDITLAIPSFDNTTVAVTVNGAAVSVENGQVVAKAGSTVVVTYAAATGYHLTAETTSQTIEELATGAAVSFTEMPVEINVYTVAVTAVEHAVARVTIGEAEAVECTTETVSVTHGQTFVCTYVAQEGYYLKSGNVEYRYTGVTQDYPTPYATTCVFAKIVATIGETNYDSIQAAIDALVDGQTLADITVVDREAPLPEGYEGYMVDENGKIVLAAVTFTFGEPPEGAIVRCFINGEPAPEAALVGNTLTAPVGSTISIIYYPDTANYYLGTPLGLVNYPVVAGATETQLAAPTAEQLQLKKAVAGALAGEGSAATLHATVAEAIALPDVYYVELLGNATENLVIPANLSLMLGGAKTLAPADTTVATIDVQGDLVIQKAIVEGPVVLSTTRSGVRLMGGAQATVVSGVEGFKVVESAESGIVSYALVQIVKPTASCTELTEAQMPEDPVLDVGYVFTATNDAEDYYDWNADFEVSFDKDVAADTVQLFGQYDADFENGYKGTWVGFYLPAVPATTKIGLVAKFDANLTYEDVARNVRNFYCGVINHAKDNAGTKMTVKLVLTKEGEEPLLVTETTYTLVAPAVTPIDPTRPTPEYETPEAAQAAADAINANKAELIAKPFETMTAEEKSAYDALVTARVVGSTVVVDFSAAGEEAAKTSVENAVKAADLLDAEKTTSTVAAIPGLYYAIVGGTDVSAITTAGTAVQATGTTVTLTKPDLGETVKAFYKVKVSVIR